MVREDEEKTKTMNKTMKPKRQINVGKEKQCEEGKQVRKVIRKTT